MFDANVYISAFIVPGSKSELAYRLAERGVFDLAVSGAILWELKGKLGSRFGYSEQEIKDVEDSISRVATIFEPEVESSVVDDEPDNRILECGLLLKPRRLLPETDTCLPSGATGTSAS